MAKYKISSTDQLYGVLDLKKRIVGIFKNQQEIKDYLDANPQWNGNINVVSIGITNFQDELLFDESKVNGVPSIDNSISYHNGIDFNINNTLDKPLKKCDIGAVLRADLFKEESTCKIGGNGLTLKGNAVYEDDLIDIHGSVNDNYLTDRGGVKDRYQFGRSARFDNSTGAGIVVEESQGIIKKDEEWSIRFHGKLNAGNGDDGYFVSIAGSSITGRLGFWPFNGNELCMWACGNSPTTGSYINTGYTITYGDIMDIVATHYYDETQNHWRINLYVDGVLISDVEAGPSIADADMLIGCRHNNDINDNDDLRVSIDGNVANLVIYNHALSADRIKTLHNNPLGDLIGIAIGASNWRGEYGTGGNDEYSAYGLLSGKYRGNGLSMYNFARSGDTMYSYTSNDYQMPEYVTESRPFTNDAYNIDYIIDNFDPDIIIAWESGNYSYENGAKVPYYQGPLYASEEMAIHENIWEKCQRANSMYLVGTKNPFNTTNAYGDRGLQHIEINKTYGKSFANVVNTFDEIVDPSTGYTINPNRQDGTSAHINIHGHKAVFNQFDRFISPLVAKSNALYQ